jgi:hypothetical protein
MHKYWKHFRKDYMFYFNNRNYYTYICFYMLPNINILTDPLSKFGIAKRHDLYGWISTNASHSIISK